MSFELLHKVKVSKINKDNPWEGDVLDRRKIAEFLTSLLSYSTKGFVLNIDSPWGTGKTFFLERWMTTLEYKYPCVHFNAWKSDHSDDALIAFLSEISDQLLQKNKGKKVPKKIGNLIGTGGKIALKSLPLLTKAAIRYGLGDEGIDEFKELFNEKIEDDIAKQVDSWTANAVKDHLKKQQTIDDFKVLLESTVTAFAKENKLEIPLYIFIDELDRCRPTYAIDLLEKIKHLFDVPGVVFIVATDTEQLSHSIKSVYGNDFEAAIYLRRFFDQAYHLPPPSHEAFAELLQKEYEILKPATVEEIGLYGFGSITEIFSELARVFNLKLRDQQRCFLRIRAAIMTSTNIQYIHFNYLSFLVISQLYDPYNYSLFNEGRIDPITFYRAIVDNLGVIAQNSTVIQMNGSYFQYGFDLNKANTHLTSMQNSVSPGANQRSIKLQNANMDKISDLIKDFGGFHRQKDAVELAGDISE